MGSSFVLTLVSLLLSARQLGVCPPTNSLLPKLHSKSGGPWDYPALLQSISIPTPHCTKPGGGWRPCGDFRRLNGCIKADCYPVPHIQDFASQLSGKMIFSKIDLIKGYHQIPVRAMDIPKTAVITPFGLFEFLRTLFGLANAAQAFQQLMDSVLQDLECVFIYLDDILVASSSPSKHLRDLTAIFDCLE